MAQIDDARPRFLLIARHVQEPIRGASTDPGTAAKDAFWRRFPAMADASSPAWVVYEHALLHRLAPALLNAAKRYRRLRSIEYKTDSTNEAPVAFSFSVLDIRYGSLEVAVAILGLPALVHYFFDNPRVVADFLELCAGEAFFEALGQPPLPGVDVFTTLPPLPAPATSAPAGSSQPKDTSAFKTTLLSAQRIWWLLPTVLALLVGYVGFAGLHSELDRLHQREAAINARELQLQALLKTRATETEALTLDLVKQLRSESAQCSLRCWPPCSVRSASAGPASAAASKSCK